MQQGVEAIAPVSWNVRPVASVFCPALDAVRPIASMAGAPDQGLALALANGRTTLRDGERIMPRLTMAGFRGALYVDYLAHDGSVAHLYPASDPKKATPLLAPGQQLRLGDPGPGKPDWVVGPPYGLDMIVAIASSVPLDLAPRPAVEENGADYLRALRAALSKVEQHGEATATVLTVETLPAK